MIALAGLEVVLLAGAAFAVGARRQARSLALLVATGGSARHVRLVVLAGGLVLGALAAAIGVGAGIIAAALARAPLESLTQAPFARFDVRPLELMAIAALGLVTGVLAAVVPARAAMRQDVVAALGGRRGAVHTRRRVPILGIVVTLFGVAAATVGSIWTAAESAANVTGGQGYLIAALIAGGACLALIGLVILSPAIMGLVGRLGARLPLAARLVARDASRHRARTAPAMAAVLAAVSGSAALVLYVSATDDRDERSYGHALPYGNAGVTLLDYGDGGVGQPADGNIRDAGPVLSAVEGQLPVAVSTVVRRVRDCPSGDCQTAQLTTPPANACPVQVGDEEVMRAAAKRDWRCLGPEVVSRQAAGGGIGSGSPAVGDAALLETLYGVDDPGAARALAAGGVVVFSRAEVLRRRATFDVFAPGALQQGPPPGEEDTWQGPQPTATVSLPAFAATSTSAGQGQAFLSPAAARRMGLKSAPSYAYFELTRLPTQDEQDAADAAIAATGAEIPLTVERGYVSAYGLGLLALILAAAVVTLGAAGIATGLAQADARADHATLAAVGAAPGLRRRLAGLGTALGVAVGFVPAVALIGAVDSLVLTLPWLQLAGMIVGVPLVAAASAWACTRSGLPLGRRAEA